MSENWRVDGFTEVRELGAGAQGRVVLARHDTAGTPVAIKYLTRRDGDGTAIERLREEAVMLGKVTDPHVVRLYRFVTAEHGAALVMEAVNGVALKEILARHGALGPEAALTVLKGSLLGLAAAHGVGVVHRDYKPANVVVQSDGLSKLIDFGIAGLPGEESRAGTPAYMAPEQWLGEPASPATDVYAATCVFFECVTGRRPYAAGEGLGALREGHLNAAVPVEAVPGPVRDLVRRGMAKGAAERPPGAAEFVTELETAATSAYGPGWEQRGIRALAGAAVALAALFPLVAAGLAPSASGVAGTAAATGTAAGGTAAGTASGASGGGIFAAASTKIVATVAVTTLAAGGVGAYAAGTRDDGPPAAVRPALVSARVVTADQAAGGGAAAATQQYVAISGHRDKALERRINAALRAASDRELAKYRKEYAGRPDVQEVTASAEVTLKTGRLISAAYLFGVTPVPDGMGNWVKNATSNATIVIDLVTGRTLGPGELFTAAALTPDGLARLAARLKPYDKNRCLSPTPFPGERLKPFRIRPADLQRTGSPIQVALAPREVRFDIAVERLDMTMAGEVCQAAVADVPLDRLADLMVPRVVTEMRAATPTPRPSPS
ncbi:hypothetical protein GCM10010191_34200 [Actinomadura vinacea]|uniref:non-specific serine/threonine protein kinase n=1 Tax=Actinomadura vinacea TaxID=115336 RepID=A0ABN3J1P0_9ACTN